jgi:hypothetical protein
MNYILVVVADVNDADYIKAIHHNVSEDTIENIIKPVAQAIMAYGPKYDCNWYTGWDERSPKPEVMYKDVLTAEQIENFGDYVPYNGDLGTAHTIEEIYYFPQTEMTRLI